MSQLVSHSLTYSKLCCGIWIESLYNRWFYQLYWSTKDKTSYNTGYYTWYKTECESNFTSNPFIFMYLSCILPILNDKIRYYFIHPEGSCSTYSPCDSNTSQMCPDKPARFANPVIRICTLTRLSLLWCPTMLEQIHIWVHFQYLTWKSGINIKYSALLSFWNESC